MITNLNLPLRTEILDIVLNVEQTINLLLLTYLSIENEERKAISNKSGNLSFKNKIDLLFDLEIFSKEEHKLFLLLMEYRNQFLHNIDCNSFTYAVSILGIDKEKSLLKFDNWKTDCDKEFRYNNAFRTLHIKSIAIALEKIRKRKQIIRDKNNLVTNLLDNSIYLIDFFFDIIVKLFEMYEPNFTDSSDVLKLKTQIFETIGQEIEKLHETDGYQLLQTQLHNSLTPDKLKMYFK
ncbi:MAG: hypothetical protein Q8N83_16550 [Ignavibacteria bacterium]|nr:hypothetical protein [Ignavibacteria bacterium]